MTIIGKIMIVLIFIMSILFMGFSLAVYSTHRNWKDAITGGYNGLNANLTRAKDQVRQLEAEIQEAKNKLALEKAARLESISVLEARANSVQERLLAKDEEFRNLQAQHREAIQSVTTYQENLARLKDEVESLRTDIRKSQQDRDTQFALVKKYTDDINAQTGQIRILEQRNQELTSWASRADLVLKLHDLTAEMPVDHIAPSVRGEVTAVRDTNLLEISLGSDEGLRRGHRLHVYRSDGSFLASVRVISTNTDRSVAEIIPDTRQGIVRKGDRVATKI